MIGAVKQRYIIQQRPKSSKENLIQFWRAEEALLTEVLCLFKSWQMGGIEEGRVMRRAL